MIKKKKEVDKHKYPVEKESVLNDMCYDEYSVSKNNYAAENSDFEANLDMLECKRNEKDAEWLSDIFLPEVPSIFLTEASIEAGQYFQTRDFVEAYLEGDKPIDFAACRAAKKIINMCLNNKRVYHYLKYMQEKDLKRISGYAYAVAWWEQKIKPVKLGTIKYRKPLFDENKNLKVDELGQPAYEHIEEDVMDEEVIYDHFNWMPIDPRNVFTDNKYVYSAQQEDWIIIRSEKSYAELKTMEEQNDYFNLDLLKGNKTQSAVETESSSESYNKDEKFTKRKNDIPKWDILERYGLHYCIVKDRDSYGYPTDVEPGYDNNGEPLDDAELVLVRQTTAYRNNTKFLIRFQAEPLRDGNGVPYMPVIRGLCYPHPTKKTGMSSAKYLRELQIAINDIMNLSMDRTKLSAFPTFIGNKYMMEENDTVYIEPEHTIQIEDVEQFKEMKINSDISGQLNMYNVCKGLMQQTEAVYPNTMGNVGQASTTATAIVGADSRANTRANYRALTSEFTFETELYWMILQMAWQFMHKKTINSILTEEEILAFKPTGDYSYKPVTSSIEAEYSKNKKTQMYDQMIGRLSGLAQANPAILPIISYVVGQILEINGAEMRQISPMLKKLVKTPMQPEGGTPPQPEDMAQPMMSNQNNIPVSAGEEQARKFI